MKKLLLLVVAVMSGVGAFAQGATCAAATTVTSGSTYVVAPITTGTYVNGCSSTTATKAVWYKFTAAASGIVTIDATLDVNPVGVAATDVDTRVHLFSGSCGGLTCVSFNDDADFAGDDYRSKIQDVVVTAGTTYYIEWDNKWTSGTVGFSWTFTFSAQTCFKPTAFTFIEAPTETTATIGWTAPVNGAPSGYQVEYGPQGFTQGTGTISNITDTQIALDGLSPSSVYSFYIRTFCGGTDYSVWVGPISFATVFQPAEPTYTTSFETTNLDFIGWFAVTSAVGADWFVNSGGVGSALVQDGASSIVSISSTTDDSDGQIISRGVNLTAGLPYVVSFYVRNYLGAPDTDTATGSIQLDALFDNGTDVITTNLITESGIADLEFVLKTATFTPATTGTYFFSFLNNSPINEGTAAHGLIVDTFSVAAPLGVSDVLAGKFSILPNPATSLIAISNTENIQIQSVSVVDLNGRTVKQMNVIGAEARINVADLATGMYMVNVTTDQGNVVKKIMKN
ncbi:MAG: T9SS type A sorting domain-containing protein [Flavobacterium sp.]|nr:T9SS type A sorting domain-containing protein [Flavobacterium sp.]